MEDYSLYTNHINETGYHRFPGKSVVDYNSSLQLTVSHEFNTTLTSYIQVMS